MLHVGSGVAEVNALGVTTGVRGSAHSTAAWAGGAGLVFSKPLSLPTNRLTTSSILHIFPEYHSSRSFGLASGVL